MNDVGPNLSPQKPALAEEAKLITSKSFGWLFAAIGGAAFVVVALFLVGILPVKNMEPPAPPNDKIRAAINNAILSCQLSASSSQKRDISLGVYRLLSEPNARGKSEANDITAAYDITLSEAGKIHVEDNVRACMIERTDRFLALDAGIRSSSSHAKPETAIDVGTGQALTGYIYYEENNGSLTGDGVFQPVNGGKLPAYSKLKAGSVLRATSGAKVRGTPSSLGEYLGEVEAPQCFTLLRSPGDPIPKLEFATTGGWLYVKAVACS